MFLDSMDKRRAAFEQAKKQTLKIYEDALKLNRKEPLNLSRTIINVQSTILQNPPCGISTKSME